MKDSETKILSFITTVYLPLASIAHLYGYWYTFNINIFEFAGFSDVVFSSIMPSMVILFFLLIVACFLIQKNSNQDSLFQIIMYGVILSFILIVSIQFRVAGYYYGRYTSYIGSHLTLHFWLMLLTFILFLLVVTSLYFLKLKDYKKSDLLGKHKVYFFLFIAICSLFINAGYSALKAGQIIGNNDFRYITTCTDNC